MFSRLSAGSRRALRKKKIFFLFASNGRRSKIEKHRSYLVFLILSLMNYGCARASRKNERESERERERDNCELEMDGNAFHTARASVCLTIIHAKARACDHAIGL